MNNIKMLRKMRDVTSQTLASSIGISQPNLSKIENNQISLSLDLANKIAEYFRVDLGQVIGSTPIATGFNDCVKINILDVKACCGTGIENLTEQVTGCWQMPLVEFKKISFADPRNVYMIQASGDSMLPTIADGDWALVDLAQNFMSSDGIYLIKLASGLAIKRLQAGLKSLTVKSDNPQYGDITAESGELTVVGKIIYILNAKKV